MSAFGGLIMTYQGRNLQAKAQSGTQLQYTRIAVGDGELNGASILDLTQLISEKMSLNISKLKTLSEGRALISTVLTNTDLSSGFYFREIGIFANDPDEGEILYCYANSGGLAEYIPAGGGADVIEKNIDIEVLTGNAEDVSAVIDYSLVYVTYPDLNEAEQRANDYTDQQINIHSHPNATQSTPGFMSITDKTKLDGVEAGAQVNTVDSVNGQTGEVNLSASDVGAETPSGAQEKADKVQSKLDEHIADTNNPHKVTAQQVGAVSIDGGEMTGGLTIKNGQPVFLWPYFFLKANLALDTLEIESDQGKVMRLFRDGSILRFNDLTNTEVGFDDAETLDDTRVLDDTYTFDDTQGAEEFLAYLTGATIQTITY